QLNIKKMKRIKLFVMAAMLSMAFVSCKKDSPEEETLNPSVDFSFSPADPKIGTAIKFTATVQDGSSDIVSWKWSFGNSTSATSTENAPSFTYQQEGTFEVQLDAKDAAGKTATVKK